jgi:hypothetical protein
VTAADDRDALTTSHLTAYSSSICRLPGNGCEEQGSGKLEHGPHEHRIGELFFCHLFEPGGNRLELQTAGQISQMPEPGTPAPSHAPPQFSVTETFGPA